jgi:two-component system sensor histidine kinase ChiS
MSEAPQPPGDATEYRPALPPKTDKSILVVEDDPPLTRLMEALLETEGYRVRCVSDGHAALEAVQVDRPALVLLDVTLPKLDGWEVLARLRSEHNPPPVVMLSAQTRAAGRAESAGAVATVLKPFDIDELLQLVARLVHDEGGGRRE